MNKRIIFFCVAASLLSAVFFVSCVKDTGKLPVAAVNACDTITYTKHIKPIIDAKCISCHGTAPVAGAPALADYASLKAYADNGKIKATVLDSPPVPELMPQGGPPLPQAQKDLIVCWLNNGKKEN